MLAAVDHSSHHLDIVPRPIFVPHRSVTWPTISLGIHTSAQLPEIILGTAVSIHSGFSIMHPISVLVTNVTFTSLVVGRLVYYQRNLRKLLGSQSSSEYTTIAAMIVESRATNIVFQP